MDKCTCMTEEERIQFLLDSIIDNWLHIEKQGAIGIMTDYKNTLCIQARGKDSPIFKDFKADKKEFTPSYGSFSSKISKVSGDIEVFFLTNDIVRAKKEV